jgi:carbamoyltransferase
MALASYGEPTPPRHIPTRWCSSTARAAIASSRPDLVAAARPGARARQPNSASSHYDIARSLQQVLEETRALILTAWLQRATGASRLSMAGGVALNCVMNARLRDEGPFDEVWVQPAAGDAGTSLGAALWVDRVERGGARQTAAPRWNMQHAYLGPAYADDDIENFLRWSKLAYRRLDDVAEETAAILADDRVIGWYQGRMEFGPRALGARSILASPISPDIQRRLNEIKDREDFRPVAPVVMEERAHQWFVRRAGQERQINAPLPDRAPDNGGFPAPYMLFVFDVRESVAARIPAVRHVDGTARVQTVRRDQHPLYHDLLAAFERRTGVPVLVNTSFNTRGEPVVCTPRDAIESFWTSPLDALVIGSFLLEKPRA